MIIKQGLPKFENKKCLIAVISNHKLETYLAYNNEINQVDDFYVDTPRYTDNEGYFGVYKRGAVYEDKHEFRNQYAHSLAHKLSENAKAHKPQSTCIFISENFKYEVMDIVPKKIKEKVTMVFFGNYTDRHPFEYLTMIKKKEDEARDSKLVKPLKPEAKKIIDKKIELDH